MALTGVKFPMWSSCLFYFTGFYRIVVVLTTTVDGTQSIYCVSPCTGLNKKLVVMRTQLVLREIPDHDTLEAVLARHIDPSNMSWIPQLDPIVFSAPDTIVMAPMSSLARTADNPDEFMRVAIAKIIAFNPVVGMMIDKPSLAPNLLNSAILRSKYFPPNHYFAAWLGDWEGTEGLRFGMINKANQTITLFNWRLPDTFNGRVYDQQEGRVLLLPGDEQIFVIFTARFFMNPLPPFTQMFGFLNLNKSTNTFYPSRPYWLDYNRDIHAKNFIPFVYNNRVHLIPSFYPMIVLRLETPTEDGHGPVTVVRNEHFAIDEHGNQIPATPSYSLPWPEEYGAHIRGGTPLAPVPGRDYFLTFFHTRVHGPAFGVDHYFMGAMTICPHPPFEIKQMSRYPLVPDPLWYEGPWFNKVASYVVYPIGIDIDPANSQHVIVSVGRQDRDTYLVTFHIDTLVNTLHPVNKCSNQTEATWNSPNEKEKLQQDRFQHAEEMLLHAIK